MDDIAKALREVESLGDIESQFLNSEEAIEFMNSCSDPINREVLWTAYGVFLFRMAPNGPDGKFDVLFFIRILAEMLKDRERLLKILSDTLPDEERTV